MNLFFAAPNNKPDLSAALLTGHKNILFSYHYFKNRLPWLKEFRDELGLYFFIDSGAFSAHTKNAAINIDEYMKFLHEFKPEMFAGLDDMKSPEKTYENQMIMEANGLDPIPTFHMGEPIKWLELYIEKYPYIALGGMVMSSNIEPWLNKVWSVIINKAPNLKVHGFGMTDQGIIINYPFYSVDSSSYSNGVRFAKISLWSEAKKLIYDQDFYKYCIDNKIKYVKGDPIIGETRNICIKESCVTNIKMVDHVTESQKIKDFSYLTAQASLF